MKALGIAATGMGAQQLNVEVIANNIANANTIGFKAGRASFQDLIYQSIAREGAPTSLDGTMRPVAIDIGLGVQAAGVKRLHTQGGLTQTGNDLDLAIEGRGYFVIEMPDGTEAYTRDGSFSLSPEGEIVTYDGYRLSPGIVVPENTSKIEISNTGTVSAYTGTDTVPQELGEITLAEFINEAGLRAQGDNLYLESAASGPAVIGPAGEDGMGLMRQGFTEASNVDTVKQITDLIVAQRTYEMNSKAITTADQMLQTINQIR